MKTATSSWRSILILLFAAILACGVSSASAAKEQKGKAKPKPKAGQAAARSDGFSDAAVAAAIKKAQAFLWSQQDKEGHWEPFNSQKSVDGPTALAVYALMASGESPTDPRMVKALDWMAKQECTHTYTLGLRCNAWVHANEATNNKYRAVLRRDVQLLLRGQHDGAYTYQCSMDGYKQKKGRWDNSNSQYGVLGCWAAALANEEIPNQYWQVVLDHWKKSQCTDGGWTYSGRGGAARATMTAAGLATLFVCFDNLLYSKFVQCKANLDFKELDRGLAWMDKNFAKSMNGEKHLYYFLYGMERVGLACGYKYFGTSDWYKIGAERLLKLQSGQGSWNSWGPTVGTSFALLFLVRGQHPIVFNKLEFDGDWNNRPRDMAQLTRWLSKSYERTLNWQVINLKVPVEEWHDAPILYLSASDAPKFTDADLAKLKKFVEQGGTILSATECFGRGFRTGIRDVYKKILPDYELKPVPRDHPLYSLQYRMSPAQVPLFMIHNGIRPLVIHTDQDLPKTWQLYGVAFGKRYFDIASNLVLYVSDKLQLRNRGVTHWPAPPTRKPKVSVKIARVSYQGNWNPEPLALKRFSMILTQKTGIKPEIETVPADQLANCDAAVACLTGTEKVDLTADQKQALKQFVQKGGLLVVDAGGGSMPFADSLEADLREIFDTIVVRPLSFENPLYKLKDNEIDKVSYRGKAKYERGLTHRAKLRGIMVGNRLGVIFSREDVTGGLLGIPMYDCTGYTQESSYDIMRNAVIYALGGKYTPGEKTAAKQK